MLGGLSFLLSEAESAKVPDEEAEAIAVVQGYPMVQKLFKVAEVAGGALENVNEKFERVCNWIGMLMILLALLLQLFRAVGHGKSLISVLTRLAGYLDQREEVATVEAACQTMPWNPVWYADHTVSQLRALCAQKDLEADVLKMALVRRLMEHDLQVSPAPGPLLRAKLSQMSNITQVRIPQEAFAGSRLLLLLGLIFFLSV